MKKYRLSAFIISFCLAIAVCMLSTNIASLSQPSAQSSGEFGLPEVYYKIIAEFSGSSEELGQNTILDKLFEALSGDPDAVAIFQYDPLYLYDPSGYYNTAEVSGGYFSKEDFLSGSEEGVLISKDSSYSLMKENGKVYYLGEYRDVVGEYNEDFPLLSWVSNDVIKCLGPGRLPGKGTPGISVYTQNEFYLANCDSDLLYKVKKAFAETGWTVTVTQSQRGSIYGRPGRSYYLTYLYNNDAMVIIPLIVIGALVLRHAACKGRSTYTFWKGFSYGIVASLTGCLCGIAVTALGKWFIYYRLLWGGVLAAAGIVMVIMMLLMAYAWMRTGKKEKIIKHGAAAGIQKVCVPVMAIVLTCLTVWFSYDDIDNLKNGIKQMISDSMLSEVKGVQFGMFAPERIIKDPTGKLAGYVEQAINDGNAFAFIQSNDYNCHIVVGSKAFSKTYKLDLPEELPAAYVSKGYKRIKKGGSVWVVKYSNGTKVPVVKDLNEDVYHGLMQQFANNDGPLVIMDTEDFVESGYEIIDAVDNMCFINADSRTLNQYAECLDELGIEYYINRFGDRKDDYYRVRLSIYGLSVIYTVLQAVILLMFLADAVNLTANRKEMEIRTELLYGAGFKEIWFNLLTPSAEILAPVGGIIGVIPKIRYYYSRYMFNKNFQIKRLAGVLSGCLAKGMAAGLVLTVIIGASLTCSIWKEHRDSFQQSAKASSYRRASV